MAKRFYLCQVVGTGTFADPYRPAVAAAGRGHVCLIPSDPATGAPLRNHCLVYLAAPAAVHTELGNTAGVDQLPNLAFTQVLTNQQRNFLINRLAARGLPTDWVVAGITFGQAVRQIGRYYFGQFDEARWDVGDVV